ncbi:hypothetical protein BKA66DRAFT_479140 [Pyrenochaeta sp. MPI-SDFR-AT-0127]|nr:hypothetical protein BKA66DRAFT_479140 [Pyrenochaeta sp. MPI-SDFR-AT-0127]
MNNTGSSTTTAHAMPSRKRARSEGSGELPSSLPHPKRCAVSVSPRRPHNRSSCALTRTNLDRLQDALSQPPLATPPLAGDLLDGQTSSPTRPSNPLHDRQKLEAYHVHIDQAQPVPVELAALLDTIRQPRNPTEAASPNAHNITARRRFATDQTERDGIRHIAPFLLFTGEAEMPAGTAAEPLVISKDEVILHKHFLPAAPDAQIKQTWGALKEARVDRCVGYVSRQDARSSRCTAPFTADEEQTLDTLCLTQRMYFPFLTSQWRTINSGENIAAAQIQAARDGASIINHLHTFYTVANGTAPSPALACHFSLVCDLNASEIWVHWREGSDYYMEHVHSCFLRDESQLLEARGILKNMLKHAVQDRLQAIKEAIPRFAQNRASYPTVVALPPSARASDSSLSLEREWGQIHDAMTPHSASRSH